MKPKRYNRMSDQTVLIALYNNHDWWDIGAKLIKWWTKSDYSHVEIFIGDYSYSSSIPDGGVRRKLRTEIQKHPDNWLVFPLQPWARSSRILEYFKETEGTGYGWIGLLLGQVLNIRIDGRGDFCSEWFMKALGIVPNAQQYSPEDARALCKALNEVYLQGVEFGSTWRYDE
jgi:hypothetical protein